MLVLLQNFETIQLQDYVLILPSVSVGNVGQLTSDLLISTLKLSKLGYIRHKNILPVAAHTKGTEGITTECEVYGSPELKIAVVQIRSTFGKWSTISPLFQTLCKSVKCTVILTGSFAYERKNIHLIADSIRFLATDSLKKCELPTIPENWKKMDEQKGGDKIQIPGSGIAAHLFQMCLEESLPAVALINFVSEGDNRTDAFDLASQLDTWLQLRKQAGAKTEKWASPSSWDSLYGNSFPKELF